MRFLYIPTGGYIPPERKVRGTKHRVKNGERDQTETLMPAHSYLSEHFTLHPASPCSSNSQTQSLLLSRINPGYYGTPV